MTEPSADGGAAAGGDASGVAPANATAALLLGLLHEGPNTGWGLAETAQARYRDFWTVTRSQVYRELAAMAQTGLVVAGETGKREARPYTITPAGRTAFAAWLEQTPGPGTVRLPFLLALSFASHLDGQRIADLLEQQRREHTATLARHMADRERLQADGSVTAAALATVEFGVRYEQAVLGWVQHASSLLQVGRT